MPLGLLSLASVLESNGISVKIYKPTYRFIQNKDYESVAKDILKFSPKVIGFSTWCTSYPGILLVAREIKRIKSDVLILFGGPQASILPVETMSRFKFVDFILAGEADHTLSKFLIELQKETPDFSTINGLYYRTLPSHKIVFNEKVATLPEMDKLPIPSYHLIHRQKSIKLDVGRGCPYKCAYCTTNNFFSKKYRLKSVNRIFEEMIHLHKNYKVTDFEFTHDLFTLRKKETIGLCKRLIDHRRTTGIRFSWNCSARIDNVDEEMILIMKEAGCNSIFFGIESGSERIQKIIRKNLPVLKTGKIADVCRFAGVDMHASYILGFPDEHKSDINQTLENILKLLLKGALVQSSILALLPGTPLFENYKDQLKYDGKFSNFSQTICNAEEKALIKNMPVIFSSFYYLPVRTMTRKSMVFLSLLINILPQFRNTFFILREYIENDLDQKNLLELFKTEYKKMDRQKPAIPPILQLISYLNKYISDNSNVEFEYINDVFAYESYSALLKKLYARWQLLDKIPGKLKITDKSTIKLYPTWKLLSTKQKLEQILPSENGWKTITPASKKNQYNYLLYATSEINCSRIRLKENETFLMNNISEILVEDYCKIVKTKVEADTALLWLLKLYRLGLISIS